MMPTALWNAPCTRRVPRTSVLDVFSVFGVSCAAVESITYVFSMRHSSASPTADTKTINMMRNEVVDSVLVAYPASYFCLTV